MARGWTEGLSRYCALAIVLLMGGAVIATGRPSGIIPGGGVDVVRFVRNPEPAPPLTLHDLDGKALTLDG
ncbi:MAG TPA: hypothetical protein VEH49_01905, partial [Methylomirabilota bacterium]|nr:hypothetical protein [Methylomirabilota bacterium]